jgi:hypothetical protein
MKYWKIWRYTLIRNCLKDFRMRVQLHVWAKMGILFPIPPNFELYPDNGHARYSLKAKPISLSDPTSVQASRVIGWTRMTRVTSILLVKHVSFSLKNCWVNPIYVKYDYDFIGKDGIHEPKIAKNNGISA